MCMLSSCTQTWSTAFDWALFITAAYGGTAPNEKQHSETPISLFCKAESPKETFAKHRPGGNIKTRISNCHKHVLLKASQDRQCVCCHFQCWKSFHRHHFWDSRQLITSGTLCGILGWMTSLWSLNVCAPSCPLGSFSTLSCSSLTSALFLSLFCSVGSTLPLTQPASSHQPGTSCTALRSNMALGSPGPGMRNPAGSSLWAPLNTQGPTSSQVWFSSAWVAPGKPAGKWGCGHVNQLQVGCKHKSPALAPEHHRGSRQPDSKCQG